MTLAEIVGLSAFVLTLIAHSVVIAYWGGGIRADLRTVTGEVMRLREWRHDEVAQVLTDLQLRVGLLEQGGTHAST